MKIFINLFLASLLIITFKANSEKINKHDENASLVKILNSKYTAIIASKSANQVTFINKDGNTMNTVFLKWDINNAWRLSPSYFLVASLNNDESDSSYNEAVLFKNDKIIKKFSNVRKIHIIPGNKYFAIEQKTNKKKNTKLQIIDTKTSEIVKEGNIPQTTSYRQVNISSDNQSVAVSPFSTDASSVFKINIFSGNHFHFKKTLSFDGAPIYETLPLANGLVAVNVNRHIVAMEDSEKKWILPNEKVDFSVDILWQSIDPNYIIAKESSGRILVINLDGSIAFDSKKEKNEDYHNIEKNGSKISIVDANLIINDSNKGKAIIISLNSKESKLITQSKKILDIDLESGHFAIKENEKIKVKRIK